MCIQLAGTVNSAVQKYFPDERIQIIAEPGRFFVAASYTLVCKIHAKREVRNSAGKLDTVMYYLNDGVYGSFNCILYDHQTVTVEHYLVRHLQIWDIFEIFNVLYIVFQPADPLLPTFKSLIWGPSCDALDKVSFFIIYNLPNLYIYVHISFQFQISEDLRLPYLKRGDLLGFPNMGAYTVPIASAFNGFPLPKTLYFKAIWLNDLAFINKQEMCMLVTNMIFIHYNCSIENLGYVCSQY